MTYALALAVIMAALHLALRLQRKRDVEMLRRHACQEGIRQGMHLDRWQTGEMPIMNRPVGTQLRLVRGADVIVFKRSGER